MNNHRQVFNSQEVISISSSNVSELVCYSTEISVWNLVWDSTRNSVINLFCQSTRNLICSKALKSKVTYKQRKLLLKELLK